jgi:hypothetical protein
MEQVAPDLNPIGEPHDPTKWWCYHFCPKCVGEKRAREKEELISLIAAKLWPGDVGRDS